MLLKRSQMKKLKNYRPACYGGQHKNAPRQGHCGGSFAETDPDPDGAEGELDQGDQHDLGAGHMS